MNKASRQKAILEILRKGPVPSQEELQGVLEKKGIEVGQATLSRDIREIRLAQNLLVIKTTVGSAQPVAAALDGETWPEVLGTLAGDDTILVISSSKKTAAGLAARIRGLLC